MITYFKNRTDVNNPSWISLDEIVHLIKEDEEIANQVRLVRIAHKVLMKEQNPEKKEEREREKAEIKGMLPGFVPSGEFTARNNKSCLKYWARIVVDIDHIEEPAKLKHQIKNDKSVIMAFISPSGDGLKIIHQLDYTGVEKDELNDFHKQAFQSLEKDYKKLYKVEIDSGGKDLSRLCFISSDPAIYYNPEPEEYSFIYIKKIIIDDVRDKLLLPELYYKRYDVYTGSRKDEIEVLEDICKWQKENQICILKNYPNWLRVMFAIKNIVGDNQRGEDLFQKLSSTYEKYSPSEVSDKWNNKSNQIDESKNVPTIGSILWLAEKYSYKCGLKGRINLNTTFNFKTAKLIDCKIYLRFNTLSKRLQIKKSSLWINLEDRDLIDISLSILGEKKVNDTRNFLKICSPEVNPAKEFLDNLPIWDGTDRFIPLSNTLMSINIDENLKLIYLRKWFIGVVHGLLNCPGQNKYNENVIILIGNQGIGKTRWVKRLLPVEYEEFFAVKNIDSQLKDDQILLSEKFIVLMDESSQLLKASAPDLKSLTSTAKFSLRAPYGYDNQDYYRVASLIGSSNDMQILSDTTGNRRFWIIEVEEADFNHNIDMYQLWAQVKFLYDKGEAHWLDSEESKLQAKNVKQFEKGNSYEDLINMFIEPGTSKDEFMNATEIIAYFIDRMGIKTPQIYAGPLGSYLTKHGFLKKHKNNKHGYYVNKKSPSSEGQSEKITGSELKAKGKAKELFVN